MPAKDFSCPFFLNERCDLDYDACPFTIVTAGQNKCSKYQMFASRKASPDTNQELSGIIDSEKDTIFIRASTKAEDTSNSLKNKAMNFFQKKKGYDVVYMPYGSSGRGFYYALSQSIEEQVDSIIKEL